MFLLFVSLNINSKDLPYFALSKDVDRLYEDLPNSVYKHKVSHPNFNHYDFIYATDVVELVYEPLFQLLTKWKT